MEPLSGHMRFRGYHNLDFIPDCSVNAFRLPFFFLCDQNSPGLIELVILERFKILADFYGFMHWLLFEERSSQLYVRPMGISQKVGDSLFSLTKLMYLGAALLSH
jgi:hypothetical protein